MTKKQLLEFGFITAAILIALFLRLYHLPELFAFTFDQGRDMVALAEIAAGDIKLLGPKIGIADGFFLGPFYFYFLLPGFLLSGGSPLGTTMWLTVTYTLFLTFSYVILKPMVGKKLAFLGMLFLVLSPGSIAEARFMWNPSLAVPTLLLSWYCLFKSETKAKYLLPALFFYGLTLQTELAYGVLLAPVYLWWVVMHSPLASKTQSLIAAAKRLIIGIFSTQNLTYKIKPSNTIYSWKMIIAGFLAASLTLIPQVLFELKNNFLMSKSLASALLGNEKNISLLELWQIRPTQLADSLYGYVFGHAPGHQIFLLGLVLGVTYISTKLVTQKEKFLLFVSITPIILSMFYAGNDGQFFSYYFSAHYLVVALLIPVGLFRIKSQIARKIMTSTVILIALFTFGWTAKEIYTISNFRYTFAHQANAYLKARELSSEQNTIEVFTPNLRPVQYQYLNEWYSETNNIQPAALNNNETGATTIGLLYEPPFAGGSLSAFREWYKRVTKDKDCGPTEEFGFITVEQCRPL